MITPIPQKLETNKEKVALGKLLFNATILSKDNTISCASCHLLSQGGDDNKSVSTGIDGLKGDFNSPTVFNAVFNFRQFWDGRVNSLEEQVFVAIENPVEMGNDFNLLIPKLKKTQYKRLFNNIYHDGITKRNIAHSISEYEKTLITPNSDFDKYLRGDENAISEIQKEGYEIFKEKGCITCHHGVNIGGNLYSKFGLIINPKISHLEKTNLTKKNKFKVPSLRNVLRTAPYLHNGMIATLDEVIKIMSLHQLGRDITSEEIYKIVQLLKSFNGNLLEEEKIK